jgi:hypothetical protein
MLEEVFQIPAEVFFVLWRDVEGECGGGRSRRAVAREADLHPVLTLCYSLLTQPELEHVQVYSSLLLRHGCGGFEQADIGLM